MRCHVYRSAIKEGLYVYVAAPSSPSSNADADADADIDDDALLEGLPAPVRRQLGEASRVMTLELDANRRLGKEDVHQVIANLGAQGFHIQMPHDIEPLLASIAARDAR